MSIILYVYFAIVILLFNTSTNCDQPLDTDYEIDSIQSNWDEPLKYLENRVDLNNDNMDAHSDNVDHNDRQHPVSEDKGIVDKLKGVWNKILHPDKYDRATYTDTLNNLHDEIFNYLNEDKWPRSLQPLNLQCQTTCNSSELKDSQKPNLTTPACNTYLKNFTVVQLDYLKQFLKCMQIQGANKKTTNAQPNKPCDNPASPKCNETPTTTKIPPTTKSASNKSASSKSASNKSASNKSASNKGKTKQKPDSGAHSHAITGNSINHTVLNDADKALLCSYNLYLNKLKFLAHLHHPVCQVGKKNLEPIDLNTVQKLIDEAKNNLQMANESLNSCKTKDETAVDSASPDIMFPFFNPYYTRKKRNFVDRDDVDDIQINEVVSKVVSKLKENDIISGNNDYSKILGTRKTKKKKKKRKKKKEKKYRESEDGAETAGKMPMNVNISNSINNFNADYNNLKFKVSPEQEEDINKFLKNMNEQPQLFNFDIEQYLNPKLVERNREPPKIKSYYEFDDGEHHKYKRKPGEFYIFNQAVADEPTPFVKPKRDLLTQRIKAISNKMKMDAFLDQPPLCFEDTSKYSRSSDSNSAPRYSAPLNLGQFKSDNDFIDKFYLLNDGNPNSMDDVKTDKHNELDKINPIDLRIDLDLDKKFRDLKWETDRKFYSDVMPDFDKKKKEVDTTNSDTIKNDDFIFYE